MSDLAKFVAARLDEEERLANAAIHAGLGIDIGPDGEALSGDPDVQDHFATWNPSRVIREVEAKRAILDRHKPHETAFDGPACNWCSEDVDDRPQLWKQPWPCPDARSLAAVWSDHPDYRPEWAPIP